MNSKNDNLAERGRPQGRRLGPDHDWDADEESATFKVVVAQIEDERRIVFARGRSPSRRTGTAPGRGRRRDGDPERRSAHGRARRRPGRSASIDETSGQSEPYPWSVETHLVERRRRRRRAVTWPSGARCAVAFTFDFDAEEVWLAGDPDAASKPGLLSMGAYGANVGVPELLRLLDRRGLPATFFVPGRVAEMHPDRVRDIVAAGHEVGAHGYTHRSPTGLSRAEEEDELVKTKAILEGFGTAVRGYRSPAWEFSVNTLDLLAAHGIGYSTNLMDRLHPYRHPNGVVELPVQWILDDAAHFWFSPDEWVKKISTPSEVREIWEEELLGIRDLGGLCVLTMHPQVIGRPSRLRFLDRFMGMVQELDDVWVAGCADIADTVTAS